jgi:hypothetical protein
VYGAAHHVSKFQTQVENVRFSWKKFKTRKLPTLEPLGGERNKQQKIFCIEKDWREEEL